MRGGLALVLLVLLAAPCVVESAAAFSKAVVEVETASPIMQQSNPLFVVSTVPATDMVTCAKDVAKLHDLDAAACAAACVKGSSKMQEKILTALCTIYIDDSLP